MLNLIMRNSWQVFHDWSLLLRSFWSFVRPVKEYYSAVQRSAAVSHLKPQDRVVKSAVLIRPCPSTFCSSVVHRVTLSPLSGVLPLLYVPARVTRGALVAHYLFFSGCWKILKFKSLWSIDLLV